VVVVRGTEVLETYERALAAFGRPIDPEDEESGPRQVRAGGC
jgi:hypothetical protein